jgi:hypothetical protein
MMAPAQRGFASFVAVQGSADQRGPAFVFLPCPYRRGKPDGKNGLRRIDEPEERNEVPVDMAQNPIFNLQFSICNILL